MSRRTVKSREANKWKALSIIISALSILMIISAFLDFISATMHVVNIKIPFIIRPAPLIYTGLEDRLLSQLATSLSTLDHTITWGFLALVAAAVSALQGEDKIKIGTLEVRKDLAGTVMLLVVCGLNFQIVRNLQNILYLLGQMGSDHDAAKLLLRTYPAFFNPFAETSPFVSLFTDNLGYALLLILWWFGFHTCRLLLDKGKDLERIGELISNLYLTFGLMSMFTIMSITLQVNPLTSLIKQLIFIGMIPVGASGIGKLFSRLQKENEN